MPVPIQITYLHHSGFSAHTKSTLLIFDDAQPPSSSPEDSLANGHITRPFLSKFDHVLFFVSHAHADHFNKAIFDYADTHIEYILSEDIPAEHEGHRMREGDTITVSGVKITAYDSTDEGVSYFVEMDGWNIFHAGDLNLWHWRSESTLKEIERAERDYLAAVEPLIGKPIDFAFFPLDPRMGEMYDAGALHFLMHVKPSIMFPMHWWERSDAAIDFARRNRTKHVEIVALTTPGASIRAEKRDDGGIIIDL